MVDAPGAQLDAQDIIALLGIEDSAVVMEFGWDEDSDSRIPEAIEEYIGESLLDDDTDEICDVVLMWWREDDGDLVDGLVDAGRCLGGNGCVWLLSPAVGHAGALGAGVVSESAQLAGMVQTRSGRLGEWQAARLLQRGASRV